MSGLRIRMDHIGIAVQSLEEAREKFARLLGLEPSPIEEVPEEGVRVSFFNVDGCKLELLEGTSPESPVRKYLEKRRSGVHHMSFALDGIDIADHFTRLKAQGVDVLGEGPTPGSRDTRVFFVHPKAAGGVLVEFSQSEGEVKPS